MAWFIVGAAAVSAGVSYVSGEQQASAAIRQGNDNNLAEGRAVVKERLNTQVRNAYATAFAQMGIALKKKQEASDAAKIRVGGAGVQGQVDVGVGSVDAVGASVDAVSADIHSKVNEAILQTRANMDSEQTNFNNELDMMVINTKGGQRDVLPFKYYGPSAGQNLGMAALGGIAQFGMSYGAARMSLGAGPAPTPATPTAG